MQICKCGSEASFATGCCYTCEPIKRAYYDEQEIILKSDKPVRNSPEYIAEFAKFVAMLSGFTLEETISKSVELTDRKFGIGRNAEATFYISSKPWTRSVE